MKDTAMDDVHMMRHVVERWLKRQEVWPDLLLIDGGVAHLNEIHALLLQHNLVDLVPLAALSKREETIHRIEREDLVLDRNGRALVFARDEAHRFVNNFHRKRRTRKDLEDPLEAIEGLGAKRLQAFYDILEAVVGLTMPVLRIWRPWRALAPHLLNGFGEKFTRNQNRLPKFPSGCFLWHLDLKIHPCQAILQTQ